MSQGGGRGVDSERVDATSVVSRLEIGHQVGHNVLTNVADGSAAAEEVRRERHVLEEAASDIKVQLTTGVTTIDEEVDGEDRLSEGSEKTRRNQGELWIVLDGILDKKLAQLSSDGVVIFPSSVLLTVFDELK